MNTIKKIFIAVFVATLICLGSCKSSKSTPVGGYTNSGQTTITQPTQPASSSLPGNISLKSDFERMTLAYQSWADITVPVKVSFSSPKSMSLSGTLTMAYGKSLSLSLKMLFVEAASIYINTDSVFVVSKLAGAYYAESLQKFTASTGFGLADIQSLLLGQAFVPGKGTATAKDASSFKFELAPEINYDGIYGTTVTPVLMPKSVAWNFLTLAPTDASLAVPQLFSMNVEAAGNTVQCTFAQSEFSQAGVIAAKMQLEGLIKDKKLDFTVASTTSKASWNTGARPTKMSISKSLTRMTTEQLMKKLGKL